MNPQEPQRFSSIGSEPTRSPFVMQPATAGVSPTVSSPAASSSFPTYPEPTVSNVSVAAPPAPFTDVKPPEGISLESTTPAAVTPPSMQPTFSTTPTPVAEAPAPSISANPPVLAGKPEPILPPEQPVAPQFAQNVYIDEPKRHLSFGQQAKVSLLVAGFVFLATMGVVIGSRLKSHSNQNPQTASSTIPEQDLGSNLIVDQADSLGLQLNGEALIVNGDIVARGGLKLYNDTFVSSVLQSNATADQTLTLPDASGTFCLDVNNCNFATATQFSAVQTQVSAISVPVKGLQAGTNVTITDLGNGVFDISSAGGTGGGTATTLTVPEGGTGLTSFNQYGVVYGNSTGALGVTVAGTSGQCLVGNSGSAPSWTNCSGVAGGATPGGLAGGDLSGSYPNPTIGKLQGTNLLINSPAAGNILVYSAVNSRWDNVALSGDVAISQTGVATIQADSVALGTDTTGNYVAALGSATGLTVGSNTGEGSTPTISVNYGSSANTAVQGNTTVTITAGTNLTGGGSITLGAGGSVTINGAASQTLSDLTLTTPLGVPSGGTGNNTFTQYGVLFGNGSGALGVTVAGVTNQCLVGNTSAAPSWVACNVIAAGATPGGTAGGDLGGTYPNPTIAKLQGTDLLINTPLAGQILIYNTTNGRWDNRSVSSDIIINETGVATIQANSVALGTDTTGNYIATLGTLTGLTTSGNTGEGSTPTLSVTYGSSASTAVQGNVTLTCPSGSGNLSGGGTSITLGAGGTCGAISTVASPSFTSLSLSTALTAGNGGTGLNTYTIGDLLYASSTTTIAKLAAAANGSCLISQGVGAAPAWGSCTSPTTILQNGNSFTAAMTIGTNDSFGLNLETNNTTVASFSNTGQALFKNASNSTTAFQIQNSTATSLLTADTTNMGVIVGSVSATTLFAAQANYTTGSNSEAVGITKADFNRDGIPDIAVTNDSTTTMSVFMNNGNGTFAAKVDYTTGTTPFKITSADFNSDGYPDLAVTNNGSTSVSVFMNNGNGTFAAKVDYTTGTSPQAIAAGDFNGDGKSDLIVASVSFIMSVFINNGDGTFAAKVDYASNGAPYEATAADFNGDGKLDVALINNNNSATMTVFINNGDGTFAAKVDYTTLGTNNKAITSGDFNGDGKADIATANYGNGGGTTMSIFMNTGTGTFPTRIDYTAGTQPTGITAADFNGDGKLDIAVTSGSPQTVSIFLNLGGGVFASKVDFSTASAYPSGITAADFNGDGKPDLGVIKHSNTISIFMNTAPSASSAASLKVVSSSPAKIAQVVQAAVYQSADILQVQDGLGGILARVTANGSLDLATGSTNLFAAKVDYSGAGLDITAIDVNGDGKKDLIAPASSGNTVGVYINNGNGTFAAKVTYATGSGPQSVAAADFNGDGKADIVVGNNGAGNTVSVLLNNGDGTFAAKVDYTTSGGNGPQQIATADFNNDGKPDIAVTDGLLHVSVFINNGNGTFATKVDYTTSTYGRGIVAADFNSDGKTDLAVSGSGVAAVSILLNNGNGTFASKVDYTVGNTPSYVTSGDFNGDGKVDIAASNYSDGTISVLLNNGNGTFASKVDYATGVNPEGITSGDYDGDGRTDIAVVNAFSAMSVFVNANNAGFATRRDYATTSTWGIVTADLNNDGRLDIATSNGSASVFINVSLSSLSAKLKVQSSSIGSVTQGLYALSGQTADLFQATNASGSVLVNITATGKIGAGVSSPTYKLSVADTQNSNVSAALANLSTTDSTSTGVLRLNVATAASGTSSRFLQFYAASTADNNGTGVGRIRLNNTGVAYETGGADFAEYFDVTESVEPGDIIAVTATGNQKATQGAQLLGVVSDTAAFVGNAKSEEPLANQAIVGLAGQVKTKVSTENGVITTGDRLAVSPTPGVAMKANPGDATIGIALESYSGAGVARIAIILDTTQAQADLQTSVQNGDNVSFADLNVGGLAQMANLTVTGNVTIQGVLTVHTAIVTGNLKVGGHIITGGNAPDITADTAIVTIEGNDTAGTISVTPAQAMSAGKVAEITFSQAFTAGKKPRIVISATNTLTAQAQPFSNEATTSNTGFELWSAGNLQSGQTYIINYLIVE